MKDKKENVKRLVEFGLTVFFAGCHIARAHTNTDTSIEFGNSVAKEAIKRFADVIKEIPDR